VFGIHGSFVLTPAEIEQAIGWDWGRKSDITEDTYFAFRAMEEGVTFDWVDGHIKEQSPFTISDIIKQRARWYTGLSLIVSEGDLSFLNRLLLALFLLSWTFAWFGSLITVLSIITVIFGVDNYFPLWATVISATIAGVFGSVYMVGVYRNVRYVQVAWYRKAAIMAATYILWFVQIVPVVEAVAVLYAVYRALFNPLTAFYVVEKDVAPAS
jgi:cellulose synthase/poly-beta-1,6-N-acetylglucosamine synthase-like glycosyltransferase